MIVIPELKKVVIMPPRSGSTSLKKTLLEVYKQAYCPHRHGEAIMAFQYIEGDWTFVYCLRDPVARLKSLWRYMQNVSPQRNPNAPPWWIREQNIDADKPFSDWVFESKSKFSSPDHEGDTYHAVAWQMPAAHKSATQYLRGIVSYPLQVLRAYNENDLAAVLHVVGVPRINSSTPSKWDDSVTADALSAIKMHHHMDYSLMEFNA